MRLIVLILSVVLAGPAVAQQPSSSPPSKLGFALELSRPAAPRLALSSPARPTKFVGATIPTQWSGQYGASTDYGHEVAVDQKGWERFWRRVNRNPPTPLNAAANMAVMVDLGERPTGGFRIEVTRTYVEDGRLVVECAELAPGSDRYVTQAFTQPWVIALVPPTTLPITFKTRFTSGIKR